MVSTVQLRLPNASFNQMSTSKPACGTSNTLRNRGPKINQLSRRLRMYRAMPVQVSAESRPSFGVRKLLLARSSRSSAGSANPSFCPT